MKTIPFDLAMAKGIHEGKLEGEIVTREGNPVEILGFDMNLETGDIIFVAFSNEEHRRTLGVVYNDGFSFRQHREVELDLLLRVPDDTPIFQPFDKVLVRDSIYDLWRCDFFSHMSADNMYACISGIYTRCRPYEGNEELVGTLNEPRNE